jgi:hypothetical protein
MRHVLGKRFIVRSPSWLFAGLFPLRRHSLIAVPSSPKDPFCVSKLNWYYVMYSIIGIAWGNEFLQGFMSQSRSLPIGSEGAQHFFCLLHSCIRK